MSALLRPRRTAFTASAPRLPLTSLVDVMVILVVFLLMSFSVDGQLLTPAPSVLLPPSTSRQPAPAGVLIAIGRDRLTIDGRDVMAASAAASDSLALDAALRDLAADGPRAWVVQCDRRHAFATLSVVLRACARNGARDCSLLVQGGES